MAGIMDILQTMRPAAPDPSLADATRASRDRITEILRQQATTPMQRIADSATAAYGKGTYFGDEYNARENADLSRTSAIMGLLRGERQTDMQEQGMQRQNALTGIQIYQALQREKPDIGKVVELYAGEDVGRRAALAKALGDDPEEITVSNVHRKAANAATTLGFNGPVKPLKDTALEAKINEIMTTYGTDRQTAAGLATGVKRVVTDPVTGNQSLVDTIGMTSQSLTQLAGSPSPARPSNPSAPAQPASDAPAQQGVKLWDIADDTAGVVPTLGELGERTVGQLGVSVAPRMNQARQTMRAAQNELIRSLSINPRFPATEISRLSKEIDIEPGMIDSPGALRGRMTAIDGYLKTRLANEERASADPSMPVDARKAALQAANDIRNFLSILGVPANGSPAGGPAAGQVEDGYRFKGGNPADPNSWEKL